MFSLPRSGSTLLQRVLMSHKEIASVAEPWLMLPFCYAFKKEGVLTEYAHNVSYKAFNDFINNLPNKDIDYYGALRAFANVLYEKQCLNDEKFFLDKTPRYYNIIPQISKAFPDAKFIFLFRNPVHVMSSIIETWGNGRLKEMYNYERDLNYGPQALTNGYKLLKHKSYALNYEDYVKKPNMFNKGLCKYLNIDFDENMLSHFTNQNTKGRMGDSTGVKEYKNIDIKSLEKWKNTFNTNYRKNYVKKYIKSIEESVLKDQGYSKENILLNIENLEIENKKNMSDRFDLTYSNFVQLLKPNIWFGNTKKDWAKNNFLS